MTFAAMITKTLEATPADQQVVEHIAQSLWQDDGSGTNFSSAHVRKLGEYLDKCKSLRVRRARRLIQMEADSVMYHGEQWWYLRTIYDWTKKAVRLLESEGKLVRWSEKTPRLVRLVDRNEEATKCES